MKRNVFIILICVVVMALCAWKMADSADLTLYGITCPGATVADETWTCHVVLLSNPAGTNYGDCSPVHPAESIKDQARNCVEEQQARYETVLANLAALPQGWTVNVLPNESHTRARSMLSVFPTLIEDYVRAVASNWSRAQLKTFIEQTYVLEALDIALLQDLLDFFVAHGGHAGDPEYFAFERARLVP